MEAHPADQRHAVLVVEDVVEAHAKAVLNEEKPVGGAAGQVSPFGGESTPAIQYRTSA